MQIQTIGLVHTWLNTPLATAMVLDFATTTFMAICLLRYIGYARRNDRTERN